MKEEHAREALNIIEDGMCRVYETQDIWQNKLVYWLCVAVRLLLLDKLREIKGGKNES